MKLDDETPDAWFVDLRHFDVADTTEAAWAISRRQGYVALHELISETEAICRRREGRERRERLEAQIAAENPAGELRDRPVAALTAGEPIPADDPVRAERRRMLAKAAHTKQGRVAIETQQTAAEQERREQARREVAAMREQRRAPDFESATQADADAAVRAERGEGS